MTIPDTPYYPYFQLLDRQMDFQSWWKQYTSYQLDYIRKGDTDLFAYVLESSPRRWYSRLVCNLYAPVARDTVKFYLPVSFDYESFLLGTCFGMYIVFRHFLDNRLCKSPQLRPGDSFCTGRNNHFYRTWKKSRINPRKYFEYDRKIFRRKILMGLPHALGYGLILTGICHVYFSQNLTWVERPFPLFIGTTWITYDLYLYDKDYSEMDFNFYKHPELYALGILMIYNACRLFRNYVCNIPSKRVLIG